MKLGMAPLAALRTATVHAADLLGVTTAEPSSRGSSRTWWRWPETRCVDITATERVSWVMVGGRVVKASR